VCLSEYRLYHTVVALNDLRAEAENAAQRIVRHGRGTIASDNRGVQFADGTRVAWTSEGLLMNGRPMTHEKVRMFAAVRREGALEVTVELERPTRLRPELRYRAVAR
jgi:hypothetical protein